MNYEPNTTHWRRGDIVLHDCDEKSPRMLMKVIGFTRDGLVKTQYCDTDRRRTIWKNEFKYLHNPERFKVNPEWGHHSQERIEYYYQQWVNVRIWNLMCKVGASVMTISADGNFADVTATEAYQALGSGDAHIWLKEHGCWSLDFVQPVMRKVVATS